MLIDCLQKVVVLFIIKRIIIVVYGKITDLYVAVLYNLLVLYHFCGALFSNQYAVLNSYQYGGWPLIDQGCVRLERLESGLAHAYDVIEIRVPNKKNFQFGLWASGKPTPVP